MPRKVLVECETDRPFKATLVDLSGTGCLLRTEHLEDIATRISLSVMVPIPESERVLDEHRSMTDFAGIYARAKARHDGGLTSLGIQCITLPGTIVRQQRSGEQYFLGIRFRWLARKQQRDLDTYLASLPQVLPAKGIASSAKPEPLFKMHKTDSQAPIEAEEQEEQEEQERGEMTKIRFAGNGPIDTSPLSTEEAKEWIDDIDERDLAFMLLLRSLRRRATHASLFIVKGKTIYGRMAIDKNGLDNESVQTLEFSLEPHSPFHQVATSGAFFVGPLQAESDEITSALKQIGGGNVPSSALLIPIFILDRLVAITVAHSHDRGFPVAHVPELLAVADATSDAAYRYLLKLRSEQQGDTTTTSVQPGGNFGQRRAPVAEMVELFARIESGDARMCKEACAEAVQRAEETLAHLDRHFPGRLTKPRNHAAGYVEPGSHGPVLGLITLLGAKATSLLATKMGEADADSRYFATLCAVGVPGSALAMDFVERLVDEDTQIKDLALMALGRLPADEVAPALTAIHQLVTEDEHLELAAEVLVYLGDTSASALFLELLARPGISNEDTAVLQSALVELTCQNFGTSQRKWRRWQLKNASKPRLEWLLEGLEHKSPEIRSNALNTLRRISGLQLPFDVFASRSERSKGREKWAVALESLTHDNR